MTDHIKENGKAGKLSMTEWVGDFSPTVFVSVQAEKPRA